MTIDFQKARPLLQEFQFSELFVQQLGWSYPSADKTVRMEVEGEVYSRSPVAELSGVGVFEISAEDGEIPNATARMAIYKEIAELVRENLLIFVGKNRTQCVWYWVKRDGTKLYPRDHVYVKREPCDLLLSKISALYVSLDELESLTVIDVAQRLQAGLDVERVTKKFFEDFKQQHLEFLSAIRGIDKEGDRRWYTSVLLNRLMFVYFLQRKGFIDGGKTLYLQEKLTESKERGTDLFYQEFLPALFFDGFAKPLDQRSPAVMALIGDIKYLNGGLFLTHQIEQNYPDIAIPDEAFEKVFALFAGYSWNLDDTLEGKENEINPAVLGYIFEKYINQKAFGAYYTRSEITEYLCDKTINKLILDRINQAHAPRQFETITELLTKLDAKLCRQLLEEILPTLSLLDPACGSGAFLVAAMKTLIYVYSNVIATVKVRITDHYLNNWLTQVETEHPSLNYYIKKRIITDNLYGVDIMEEATEIAKLRLFLALVSSAHDVSELEPLPNIDFNIMAGNSLIGLIRVDETGFDAINSGTKGKGKKKDSEPVAFQGNLLQPLAASAYQKILTDKNDSIDLYKKHAFQPGEQEGTSQESRLLMLRRHIEQLNRESQDKLNLLLLDEFSSRLGIKYQEVQISGKPKKRVLKIDDIAELKPFHWGYHFDIILKRGGFDAILTNPPWEIFKPNAKEFFAQYSDLVTRKKMDIHAFEKEQKKLLQDPEIANNWVAYQNQFPHVNFYYRTSSQYSNQISIVNGKKEKTTDINLYKLFLEQCFNLLRPGGECGIVIPSGIYTDLGAKQLREMLFNKTQITGLFVLENKRAIFEGVHSSFKIAIITFEKGSKTDYFPAVFMRHDINEIREFPNADTPIITLDFLRRASPDSLSVIEIKNDLDIKITEKMLKFPMLGEQLESRWNLVLSREFHMTDDKNLFQNKSSGLLPLYEGKMIHQFTHLYAEPRYWVDEEEGREALLGKKGTDNGQKLDYQGYRFAYRAIARSTDSRTLIGTVLPKNVICGHSLNVASAIEDSQYMLLICAVLNSVCFDFALRQKVSANLTIFFLYQTPVPRLTSADRFFAEIVDRAAKLICTTPEFDELAQEVGLTSHQDGVTDEGDRAQLRAELDGIIAHIYGLNEEEFTYILSTFPLVSESVKEATLEAYRNFAPLSGDPEIINLITQGEGHHLEFKSTARWNLRENKKDKAMEHEIVKTVAGFLNANGGTLLIGVNDDGVPLGLKSDYQTLKKSTPDGLALFLNNDLLLREIGKECGTLWQITVHQVSGFEVCRVVVQPSPKPIYVKVKDKAGKEEDCFYLRSNNSTVKLSLKEAIEYANTRW